MAHVNATVMKNGIASGVFENLSRSPVVAAQIIDGVEGIGARRKVQGGYPSPGEELDVVRDVSGRTFRYDLKMSIRARG